jgi:alkylation response protein AidB-like acyl-CoA dehydrogenase
VTSELSYERSGPDRFLSTYQLLETYLAERAPPAAADAVGRLASRYWTIRQMSLSVARALEQGQAPAVESAMVKDLGTTFEQEVVAVLQDLLDHDPDPGSSSLFESLLAQATLVAPSYTIRGGTTEVLRGVVARSLRGQR